MYLTSDIWPGVYSSHQRCLEALERLGITPVQPQSAISAAEYLRLLEYRLNTANGEKQTEVQCRIARLIAGESVLNTTLEALPAHFFAVLQHQTSLVKSHKHGHQQRSKAA